MLGHFKEKQPPIYKESYLLTVKWNYGYAYKNRPCLKSTIQKEEANKSHDSRNYSSKKSFQEFETDSKLLTYLNWFRHKRT